MRTELFRIAWLTGLMAPCSLQDFGLKARQRPGQGLLPCGTKQPPRITDN
jgi:hypothetical protein